MRKSLFLLGLLLMGQVALAEQTVRKVPFLPYAGMARDDRYDGYDGYYYNNSYYASPTIITNRSGQTTVVQPFSGRPARKGYESIFFEDDTANIRGDQYEKLRRLAHRLANEGSHFYSIVTFTTPEIDRALAQDRVKTLVGAMEDFGIHGEPTVYIEYKDHPVLNPNRVEVYMRAQGLGTTIRK